MPVFAHGGAMHKALAETGGLLWTDSRFEPRTPCRVDELQELTLEAARAICYAKFPDLRCSITAALLQDPVSASDGIMYSGPALRRWWEGKHIFTSPLTGAVLATNDVRPAFAVSALTQQLLNDAIDSGKAAALAGYQGDMDDAVEIANTMATLAGEICPPDDFLRRLHDLCADAHLRDFAGACGALGVAAACFTARQNSVTVAFLVRMLAFQAEHQEKLAWMIPVAVAGLSGSDAERHSLCFQVLSALVCDRKGIPEALQGELRIFSPLFSVSKGSFVVRTEAPVLVVKNTMLFLLHLLVGKEANADLRKIGETVLHSGVRGLLVHVLLTVKDAEVLSIACCLVRVLAGIHADLKATLRSTPGLLDELENAATHKMTAYFALRALAAFSEDEAECLTVLESITSTPHWARNPRTVVQEIVNAMHDYPRPMLFSKLGLSLLNAATGRAAAIFEPGVPSREDIACYLFRTGVEAILEAVHFACTHTRFRTVQEGLSLLGNMAALAKTAYPRWGTLPPGQIFKMATGVVGVLNITAQHLRAESNEAQRTRTLRQALVVLHRYMELTTAQEVLELELKHKVIECCRQELEAAALRLSALSSSPGDHNVSVINDFICEAFAVIGCVCRKTDYSALMLGSPNSTSIAKFLVDSLNDFGSNQMVNFQIAEVLQTLTRPSYSDQDREDRVLSGSSLLYANDMVENKMYQALSHFVLREDLNFKTVLFPVLCVLRDIASRLGKKQGHEEDIHKWLENTLLIIRSSLAKNTPNSALTVKICLETTTDLLLGEALALDASASVSRDNTYEVRAVAPLMFEVLEAFSMSGERTMPHVLKEAFKVLILTHMPVHMIEAGHLDIVAQVIDSVGNLTEAQRTSSYPTGLELSDNSICLELACNMAYGMIESGLPEPRHKVLSSPMVRAMITVLRQAAVQDERLRITQLGLERCVWVLRALLPLVDLELKYRIAEQFAALLLKNNRGLQSPCIDLTSDSEGEFANGRDAPCMRPTKKRKAP